MDVYKPEAITLAILEEMATVFQERHEWLMPVFRVLLALHECMDLETGAITSPAKMIAAKARVGLSSFHRHKRELRQRGFLEWVRRYRLVTAENERGEFSGVVRYEQATNGYRLKLPEQASRYEQYGDDQPPESCEADWRSCPPEWASETLAHVAVQDELIDIESHCETQVSQASASTKKQEFICLAVDDDPVYTVDKYEIDDDFMSSNRNLASEAPVDSNEDVLCSAAHSQVQDLSAVIRRVHETDATRGKGSAPHAEAPNSCKPVGPGGGLQRE